jgi:hypothetical protein
MSRYVGRHHAVCLSRPKETHYFLSPSSASDVVESRANYRRNYFPELRADHEVLLDGSISYLYNPDAAKRALKVFPEARFIVMFRNPVDLVHSYHGRLLYYRQETETDLRRAWALQDDRRSGRNIPRGCSDPKILLYREVGSLGRHFEAFLEAVGRERCLFVFYDDFVKDPLASYKQVLSFAGLPYDGRTDFPQKAPHRTFRNKYVQDIYSGAFLMRLLPVHGGTTAFYGRLARMVKPARKWLRRFNAVKVSRAPLDHETRTMLLDAFRDDIALLARLTGRNLDDWRTAGGTEPTRVAVAG